MGDREPKIRAIMVITPIVGALLAVGFYLSGDVPIAAAITLAVFDLAAFVGLFMLFANRNSSVALLLLMVGCFPFLPLGAFVRRSVRKYIDERSSL